MPHQTFQRFMDQVMRGLPYCFIYLDDLLVPSPNMATRLEHLTKIFRLLSAHDILINLQTCEFAVPSLDFLGHHVSAAGITGHRNIKTALSDASLLSHPHPITEVCLMTDASLTCVGGALQQQIDGAWQPLSLA